ncbi:hypothetical protein D3C79_918830 [compost metagenome]
MKMEGDLTGVMLAQGDAFYPMVACLGVLPGHRCGGRGTGFRGIKCGTGGDGKTIAT